jgi:hypothetical protein
VKPHHRYFVLASVLAAGAACAPALGDPVLLRMEGVIDSGAFTTGPFTGAGVGDTVVLEWLFDSSTPNDSGDTYGVYLSSQRFDVTVGSHTYSDFAVNDGVTNASGIGIWDNYYSPWDEVLLYLTFPGAGAAAGIDLPLFDYDGAAFNDYDFPTAFPALTEFESNYGRFFGDDTVYFIATSLTIEPYATGIPLPSAGAIACTGLAGLAIRRRRSPAQKGVMQ